jgi:RNA polymerase sigma-70 factor (ECF subfamily)
VHDFGDHLFRREAARITATLVRVFGVHNLALAEDVVQDTLCRALEVWKLRGVPENPQAWLMTTAKNRAVDVLRRERTARRFAPELGRLLDSEWTLAPVVEELFEPRAVKDDELRMMFSCCHPRLAEEAQVALVLHVCCGFGIGEIAAAFFAGEAAIEKRVARAKRVLAESKRLFDPATDAELAARLAAVQRAVYLLFNEGYHGAGPTEAVRADLCREALRLVRALAADSRTATPATRALAALLSLGAARLPARVDATGELVPLDRQDRARWDAALVGEGLELLDASATGAELSEYHVEAAIASLHVQAARAEDTRWGAIVALYDTLFAMHPSPVVALNRAVAVAQLEGPERGLDALSAIEGVERLAAYPFYAAAVGELELRRGRSDRAAEQFRAAASLARSPMERRFFEARAAACGRA